MKSILYRRDIQALRGVAVLLVLAHHAKLPFVRSGYIGVDIFFVISGFLITSLVAENIQRGTFSFLQFYWLRSRRLLPAAYVTIAVCALLSPVLLTHLEMRDFVKQVIGAVTLTANIVLWLQTGYFERAAELKPLLHYWSLSIEEQYYLILPTLLFLLPRQFWLRAAVATTLISLTAYFVAEQLNPGVSFYFLPTRAWEMGFGSILAIQSNSSKPASVCLSLRNVTALLVIGGLCIVPLTAVPASACVLLASVATVVLLAHPISVLSIGFFSQMLSWVGDRSYSLYLVHWPVFAFLNSAYVGGGGVGWRFRLAGILLSLFLAVLLYSAVEIRFRFRSSAQGERTRFSVFLATSALLCCSAIVVLRWFGPPAETGDQLRTDLGVSESCNFQDSFAPKAACKTAESVRVMVWGDSYAAHLVPGLIATSERGLVQATRSSCPPVLNVALYAPPELGADSARSCTVFNSSVMSSLAGELASVEVVVLSSAWVYLLTSRVLVDGASIHDAGQVLIAERLRDTITRLRAIGKRVVMVAPPPIPGFDAGRCNERLARGLWSFGGSSDCHFDRQSSFERSRSVHGFLDQVSRENDLSVVRFDDVLCSAGGDRCVTRWDKVFLYRDIGHLSYGGSIAIAEHMELGRLVSQLAR